MSMQVKDSVRLSYRLMTEADKDLLFDLDQDPKVMRFMSDGVPTSRADVENIILPRIASFYNPEKGWGLWAAQLKDSGEFIGWILARPMNFFSDDTEYDNIELGWRFKSACWGKGLATEAANAVALAVSEQPEVSLLSAIAVPENLASIGVMKKMGMQFVKSYVHKDPLFESTVDYYQMSAADLDNM